MNQSAVQLQPTQQDMALFVDARAKCPVERCGRPINTALLCDECWCRLPEGVQRCRRHLIDALTNPRALDSRRNAAAEVIEHAARRLAAEKAGPLSADDLVQADALTQRYNALGTFAELLDAPGGYFPKLDCSARWTPDAEQRAGHALLADYYDRAQAARGDERRCVRLGFCGL